MFEATLNNTTYKVAQTNDGLTINDLPIQWDIAKVTNTYFHILHNNKGYRAEVVKADTVAKTFVLKINGRTYTVSLKGELELMLEKMGMDAAVASRAITLKAPMPGLIIDLKVKAGDVVKAGDPLLVLEAMKMENILKCPGDGKVKSVKVEKGNSVEKGQVLIEF